MAPTSSIPENALKYLSMRSPKKIIDVVQLYPDEIPVLADPSQPKFRSCWGHENLCNVGAVYIATVDRFWLFSVCGNLSRGLCAASVLLRLGGLLALGGELCFLDWVHHRSITE